MTRHYAHRNDLSQRPLVSALRQAGIRVWKIGRPCDLLLYFWCNRHHDFCWQTLEVKTAQPNGRRKIRYDQAQQTEFILSTRTPIAVDFPSAWTALNALHRLGRIDIPCLLKPENTSCPSQ